MSNGQSREGHTRRKSSISFSCTDVAAERDRAGTGKPGGGKTPQRQAKGRAGTKVLVLESLASVVLGDAIGLAHEEVHKHFL